MNTESICRREEKPLTTLPKRFAHRASPPSPCFQVCQRATGSRNQAAVRLNASRNMGFTPNVSKRALKVAGTSLAVFFHQEGMSPQRIGTKSTLLPRSITTSMTSGGADIVARRQIALRCSRHSQPVERNNFAPRQPIGQAPAHVCFLKFENPGKFCPSLRCPERPIPFRRVCGSLRFRVHRLTFSSQIGRLLEVYQRERAIAGTT
jgi:hypothetical protein